MSRLTHRRRSAVLAGAGAAAALCLLAACGGGGGGTASDDHGVASVAGPAAKGGSARPDADDDSGRPQLRLDTSQQERDRLTFVYFDCLRDHGVPGGHKPGSSQWFPGGSATRNAAAYKACLVKKPLQPPELDPAKNPHYLDDFRTYIRCLNDGGLKVKGLADGSGWNYDGASALTPAQQDRLDHDCELKAYKQ
ncbi:hypothetical protein OG496_45935 [Streptomyces sp. NBC_00988]|uniref:hypothetical protein n=1 Tax=Streptomyces sp. NBC_00988 TaxID=2903704 RepID=UPI0038636B87|nr:hypothetical protein OG496_45935 [Streptomyces sp. NBC_00988]